METTALEREKKLKIRAHLLDETRAMMTEAESFLRESKTALLEAIDIAETEACELRRTKQRQVLTPKVVESCVYIKRNPPTISSLAKEESSKTKRTSFPRSKALTEEEEQTRVKIQQAKLEAMRQEDRRIAQLAATSLENADVEHASLVGEESFSAKGEMERIQSEYDSKQRALEEAAERERAAALHALQEQLEEERRAQAAAIQREELEAKQRLEAETQLLERKRAEAAAALETLRLETEAEEKKRAEAVAALEQRKLEAAELEKQRVDEAAALLERQRAEAAMEIERQRVEAAELVETQRLEAAAIEQKRLETVALLEQQRLEALEALEREREEAAKELARQREEAASAIEAQRLETAAELERQRAEHAAAMEAQRVEAAALEKQRLEAAALEAQRAEAAAIEKRRLEAIALEAVALEAAVLEKQRLEAARLEKQRLEAAALETQRLNAIALEEQRLEIAAMERQRAEAAAALEKQQMDIQAAVSAQPPADAGKQSLNSSAVSEEEDEEQEMRRLEEEFQKQMKLIEEEEAKAFAAMAVAGDNDEDLDQSHVESSNTAAADSAVEESSLVAGGMSEMSRTQSQPQPPTTPRQQLPSPHGSGSYSEKKYITLQDEMLMPPKKSLFGLSSNKFCITVLREDKFLYFDRKGKQLGSMILDQDVEVVLAGYKKSPTGLALRFTQLSNNSSQQQQDLIFYPANEAVGRKWIEAIQHNMEMRLELPDLGPEEAPTYYTFLQVTPEQATSSSVLLQAYADQTRTANDPWMLGKLNEALQVLNDPFKKLEYDNFVQVQRKLRFGKRATVKVRTPRGEETDPVLSVVFTDASFSYLFWQDAALGQGLTGKHLCVELGRVTEVVPTVNNGIQLMLNNQEVICFSFENKRDAEDFGAAIRFTNSPQIEHQKRRQSVVEQSV